MNEFQRGPCVYFISDGQCHVKIGIASDIKQRLNTLQVGSAFELSLIHAEYTETIKEAKEQEEEYHRLFSGNHVRGEWYEQEIVEKYLSCGELPRKKQYLCDIIPDFNLAALLEGCIQALEKHYKETMEKE